MISDSSTAFMVEMAERKIIGWHTNQINVSFRAITLRVPLGFFILRESYA
jgi:hypothetical protein